MIYVADLVCQPSLCALYEVLYSHICVVIVLKMQSERQQRDTYFCVHALKINVYTLYVFLRSLSGTWKWCFLFV